MIIPWAKEFKIRLEPNKETSLFGLEMQRGISNFSRLKLDVLRIWYEEEDCNSVSTKVTYIPDSSSDCKFDCDERIEAFIIFCDERNKEVYDLFFHQW